MFISVEWSIDYDDNHLLIIYFNIKANLRNGYNGKYKPKHKIVYSYWKNNIYAYTCTVLFLLPHTYTFVPLKVSHF